MHCTPEENLECATSLLQDETYQWWVSMTRTAPLESVTWEFFLAEFKKQYVGHIYLINMRREFHNLKQMDMSVTKYWREFTRLSKYAPEMLVTEEEKCRKFEDGLNGYIPANVIGFGHEDFSKIVTCARNVERVKKEEYDRKERRQRKKNPDKSSSYQHQNKKLRGPQGSNQPTAQGPADECLKHSYYTRVGHSFSRLFYINYIVFVARFLNWCLVWMQVYWSEKSSCWKQILEQWG